VSNLARYISHEGLVPPVAIGVFGDWGSGKTFFIRALQSQIALLSSQSRGALAATPSQTTVFCSHIVQIEFNAWHFVESNLWASLAAHIFDRLYAELERRSREEKGNSNVDGLYQQFSPYKQAVAEQKRLSELVTRLRRNVRKPAQRNSRLRSRSKPALLHSPMSSQNILETSSPKDLMTATASASTNS
jgi:KAP family P-loop domain